MRPYLFLFPLLMSLSFSAQSHAMMMNERRQLISTTTLIVEPSLMLE